MWGRQVASVADARALRWGAGAGLAVTLALAFALFASTGREAVVDSGSRAAALDDVPLSFVPNRGQLPPATRYEARGAGYDFRFTERGVDMLLQRGGRAAAVQLAFAGSSRRPAIHAARPAAARVSYMRGADTARHIRALPTYHELVYRELWPGIDLAFKSAAGTLKYELRLKAGANPAAVRMAYRGAQSLALAADGALIVRTGFGSMRDTPPRAFQRTAGGRASVESRFRVLDRRRGEYGFALGPHDRARPLVIDPGIEYSTLLGGISNDVVYDVAVDAEGSAYVTGFTASGEHLPASERFPTTSGAFDTDPGPTAFVTKLNPSGSALVYSTFIGGHFGSNPGSSGSSEDAWSIAVDARGAAYVTGDTTSSDFPTTPGSFGPTSSFGSDVFVSKLDPAGSELVYSGLIAGSDFERSESIALGPDGSAFIVGSTTSPELGTPGAFDPVSTGDQLDAFVAKISAAGSAVDYFTFLGGDQTENGRGIAVDSAGQAIATGSAGPGFPVTPGAYQTERRGSPDVFVTKLNADGSALRFSTLLGGDSSEAGRAVALDARGDIYVAGGLFGFRSTNPDFQSFPTTAGAFDRTPNFNDADRAEDPFAAKFSRDGSQLIFSTLLGGREEEDSFDLAVDRIGRPYVSGWTASPEYPTTEAAHDRTWAGRDAFLTVFDTRGSALVYSTLLGGSATENAVNVIEERVAVAADQRGDAYVTGTTKSADFPTTAGAWDGTHAGTLSADSFLTKFSIGFGPAVSLALEPAAAVNPLGTEHCVTATARDARGDVVPGVHVRFSVMGAVTMQSSSTTGDGGEARLCYGSPDLPGTDTVTAYVDADADGMRDAAEPGAQAAKSWALPPSSEFCRVADSGAIVAANGDRADFRGDATVAGGAPSGKQTFTDHGPAERLRGKSLSVDALVCGTGEATIFGRARLNGPGRREVTYRIDLTDARTPAERDTYRLLLSSGYDSGVQRLRRGNVSVRAG